MGWSVGLAGIHVLDFGIDARQPHEVSPGLDQSRSDTCIVVCFERRGHWYLLLCCNDFFSAHLYPHHHHQTVVRPRGTTNHAASGNGAIAIWLHVERLARAVPEQIR